MRAVAHASATRAQRRRKWRIAILTVTAALRMRGLLRRAVTLSPKELRTLKLAWLAAVQSSDQAGAAADGSDTAARRALLAQTPPVTLDMLTSAKGLRQFFSLCGIKADLGMLQARLAAARHSAGAVVDTPLLLFVASRCKARHVALRGGEVNPTVRGQLQLDGGEGRDGSVQSPAAMQGSTTSGGSGDDDETDVFADIFDAVREFHRKQQLQRRQRSQAGSPRNTFLSAGSPRNALGSLDDSLRGFNPNDAASDDGSPRGTPLLPTLQSGDAAVTETMVKAYVMSFFQAAAVMDGSSSGRASNARGLGNHSSRDGSRPLTAAARPVPSPISAGLGPVSSTATLLPPRLVVPDDPLELDDGTGFSKRDARSMFAATLNLTPSHRAFGDSSARHPDDMAIPNGSFESPLAPGAAAIDDDDDGEAVAFSPAAPALGDLRTPHRHADRNEETLMGHSRNTLPPSGSHSGSPHAASLNPAHSHANLNHLGSGSAVAPRGGPRSSTGLLGAPSAASGTRRSRVDSLASQFSVATTGSSGTGRGSTVRVHHHHTAIEKACHLLDAQVRDLMDKAAATAARGVAHTKAHVTIAGGGAPSGDGATKPAAAPTTDTQLERSKTALALASHRYMQEAFPTLHDALGRPRQYTLQEVEQRLQGLRKVEAAQAGGLADDEDEEIAQLDTAEGANARMRIAQLRRSRAPRRQPVSRSIHYCSRALPNAPDTAAMTSHTPVVKRPSGDSSVFVPRSLDRVRTPDVSRVPRAASMRPASRENRDHYQRVRTPAPLGAHNRLDRGILDHSRYPTVEGHRDLSCTSAAGMAPSLLAYARMQVPLLDSFSTSGGHPSRDEFPGAAPVSRFAALALSCSRPNTAASHQAFGAPRAQTPLSQALPPPIVRF
jgi:hypothetical protein